MAENKQKIVDGRKRFREANREKLQAVERRRLAANGDAIRAQQKEYRERNKEKLSAKSRKYHAENREIILPMLRARYRKNAEERQVRARIRRDQNLIAAREKSKENYRNNKAEYINRARNRKTALRGADGKYTTGDILCLYEKQGGKCATCKVVITDKTGDPKRFHVDHVMPVSKGGSNWPENLQLLCRRCNITKKDADPEEWARRNGRLFC